MNFDVSPTLRLQQLPVIGAVFRFGDTVFPRNVRYGDIVAGLPLADNSVDGIYASHVLEHLYYDDVVPALRNTYRLLKPGGIFRLIVPDLEPRARRYLKHLDSGDSEANDWFLRTTMLGRSSRPRGLVDNLRELIGNSDHRWMWDERSMRMLLGQAGFVDIRRAAFNDCEDPQFRLVESESRFRDPDTDIDECALEARKPLDQAA